MVASPSSPAQRNVGLMASTWVPEIGKRKGFDMADFVKYALGI